jgi:competence protein ComEA
MSRSVGQARKESTASRGGVWIAVAWTWPAGARVFLALILLISTVALRAASRSLGTDLRRNCRIVPVLVIDPNTTPASVLEALPHVGPSLVRKLIEQREIHPFRSTEDLRRRVRGVGPATLARLAPHLRIAARSETPADTHDLEILSDSGQPRLARRPRSPARSRQLRNERGIAAVAGPVHDQVEHSIGGLGVDNPGQVTVDLGEVAVGRVDDVADL